MGYILTHWRGALPISQAFWVNGVLLRLLVYGGFAILVMANLVSLPLAVLLIGLDAMIMVWQLVGYFRASENVLRDTGSMLPIWGGMIAVIVVAFVAVSQWWALGLAAQSSVDEEQYATRMERLRQEEYALHISDDGGALEFSGAIVLGASRKLAAVIGEHSNLREVVLNSNGGNVFEARAIARLVLARGFDTHVRDSCSSACTIVFAAGKQRSMAPNATIGFHGYVLKDAQRLPRFDVAAQQDQDLTFMLSRGLDAEFVARIYETAPTDLWFPSRGELTKAGVLTDHPLP